MEKIWYLGCSQTWLSGLPSIDPFKEIEPIDSDYIVQIDIDPVAKDNEYDFTTEKEICDTDTTGRRS